MFSNFAIVIGFNNFLTNNHEDRDGKLQAILALI